MLPRSHSPLGGAACQASFDSTWTEIERQVASLASSLERGSNLDSASGSVIRVGIRELRWQDEELARDLDKRSRQLLANQADIASGLSATERALSERRAEIEELRRRLQRSRPEGSAITVACRSPSTGSGSTWTPHGQARDRGSAPSCRGFTHTSPGPSRSLGSNVRFVVPKRGALSPSAGGRRFQNAPIVVKSRAPRLSGARDPRGGTPVIAAPRLTNRAVSPPALGTQSHERSRPIAPARVTDTASSLAFWRKEEEEATKRAEELLQSLCAVQEGQIAAGQSRRVKREGAAAALAEAEDKLKEATARHEDLLQTADQRVATLRAQMEVRLSLTSELDSAEAELSLARQDVERGHAAVLALGEELEAANLAAGDSCEVSDGAAEQEEFDPALIAASWQKLATTRQRVDEVVASNNDVRSQLKRALAERQELMEEDMSTNVTPCPSDYIKHVVDTDPSPDPSLACEQKLGERCPTFASLTPPPPPPPPPPPNLSDRRLPPNGAGRSRSAVRIDAPEAKATKETRRRANSAAAHMDEGCTRSRVEALELSMMSLIAGNDALEQRVNGR